MDQDKYSSLRNSNPSSLQADALKGPPAVHPEKGSQAAQGIQSVAAQLECSLTSVTDTHHAGEGGESPGLAAPLGRRQKNLTMASGITISQVKPVLQFRRSTDHLRRSSNYTRKSGGPGPGRSGSIEFPATAQKADGEQARASANGRAEYSGQSKGAYREGRRGDR